MSRPLVYIAGPYAGPSEAVVERNVDRVAALSRWLVAEGYAPVQVHTAIAWEAMGDDSDPAQRAMGLEAACALVEAVARAGGAMVVITSAGRISPGCAAEIQVWQRVADDRGRVVMADWSEWMERVGAGDIPAELAVLRSGRRG